MARMKAQGGRAEAPPLSGYRYGREVDSRVAPPDLEGMHNRLVDMREAARLNPALAGEVARLEAEALEVYRRLGVHMPPRFGQRNSGAAIGEAPYRE